MAVYYGQVVVEALESVLVAPHHPLGYLVFVGEGVLGALHQEGPVLPDLSEHGIGQGGLESVFFRECLFHGHLYFILTSRGEVEDIGGEEMVMVLPVFE